MKQILAILLLVSVSYQFVAKMGVIVWYEANIDYVATELCKNKDKPELQCNGKCYLKKQLNKVDDTQQDKQQPVKKVKSELPEYIASTTEISFSSFYTDVTSQYAQYNDLYQHRVITSIFHPPSVC